MINYVSIESVLYDLSTLVEEDKWNEGYFREWAYIAAKKMNPEAIYEDYVALLELNNHKAIMPNKVKYINGIFHKNTYQLDSTVYKEVLNLLDVDNNPALTYMDNSELLPLRLTDLYRLDNRAWKPLKRTSSPFMKAIHCTNDFIVCPECQYEYSVSAGGVITSTAKEGILLLSYKSYPYNENLELLIPDFPEFKEAITHYCLYRMYTKRVANNEEGAYREREWHLNRYNILAGKAKSLNLPDIETLEKLKNEGTRLVTKSNRFNGAFFGLGNQEQTTY